MDNFERVLTEKLDRLQAIIDKAKETILAQTDVLEDAENDMTTFRELLDEYKAKKERDAEAYAMFYMSERKDADFKELCEATGVGEPEELSTSEEINEKTATEIP